eukprot:TRINITY_DN47916_c0_g1_i1.p1 TRINITY_DN47916_c0_g1~~TRINITY_DN47916_c0_g1_i1.p1  ORF type:complete len:377 (+),score=106.22 TRINITY_DN47916_c0_g1_i1:69-1199(+)
MVGSVGRVARVGDSVVVEPGDPIQLPDSEGNPSEWELRPGEKAAVIEVDGAGDVRLRNPDGVESGWAYAKHFFHADGGGRCANTDAATPEDGDSGTRALEGGGSPNWSDAAPSAGGRDASPKRAQAAEVEEDVVDLVVTDASPEADPELAWRDEDGDLKGAVAGELAAAAAVEAVEKAKAAAQRAARLTTATAEAAVLTLPAADDGPVPTVLLLKIERHAEVATPGVGKHRSVQVFMESKEIAKFVDDSDTRRAWRALKRSGTGSWVYATAAFEIQYARGSENEGCVSVWSKDSDSRAFFKRDGNRWVWQKYVFQRFGGPVGSAIGDPWWEFRGPRWPEELVPRERAPEWGRVWGGWVETCYRQTQLRSQGCCIAQ